MPVTDLLLQLSEIAVAFAGFSGVVAALGRSIEWDEKARFRFQNLLVISVSAVFLALLPLALSTFNIASERGWMISLCVMVAFALGFFVLRAPIARRLTGVGDRVTFFTGLMFLIGLSTVVVLQVLGVAGVLTRSAVYVAGIVLLLFLSALQFAVLSLGAMGND